MRDTRAAVCCAVLFIILLGCAFHYENADTRHARVTDSCPTYIACHLSHQQHLSSQYNNSHMTTLKRTTPRENFATVANGVQAHALARYNASLGDGVGGPEEGCLDLSSRELHFHRNLPR